jgi:LPS-assembly protein
MRNNFLIFFYCFFIHTALFAENLLIESRNINLDKNTKTSVFKNDVSILTEDKTKILSDYAKYDKANGYLQLKENIKVVDIKNNIIQTNYAEYFDKDKIFKSKGITKIMTTDNYTIIGEDIFFDNKKNIISSEEKTTVIDEENNKIFLNNFKYDTINNIFRSIGMITVEDKIENKYEFTQIYIDTKNKEIIGSDSKAFLNANDFKINSNNKPRVFSNSLKISGDETIFNKNVCTLCDYRSKDKCPPWSIQSKKMLHDNKKKTIYYDNAVIKIYDVPIFYFPKLSHPDPTVKRRSGFLIPTFTDSNNLGSAFSIPYFWALGKDKDLTFTSKLFANENPLFLSEYRHAFKDSNLVLDMGYTGGYKESSSKKQKGDKSHFFSEFKKTFLGKDNSINTLVVKNQNVSNNKYLKLYKIKSNLTDFNQENLENSINFTRTAEDSFFGINTNIYETLKSNPNDNDKYEYIYPEIIFDKNLVSNDKFGNLDLQSHLEIRNFDTNKTSKFLINDFDWLIRNNNFDSGLQTKLLSKIKNINYDSKNIDKLKEEPTSQIHGALGLLTEINLFKKSNKNLSESFLKPKMLLRYSPGNMKKEKGGSRLDPSTVFDLDRMDKQDNFEKGLSAAVGFDYEISNKEKEFALSIGQVINQKENKKMASKTSLDEKLSDLVGASSLQVNDKLKFNYNFSLDQNFSDLNYNELSTVIDYNILKFNFDYIQEKKHVGNNEYFKAKADFKYRDGILSFGTKRSLITNSSEYYDLSYEYFNDCLRAGLVYRREFYNDSEIEAENSLMFKITLVPFGKISSPSINK